MPPPSRDAAQDDAPGGRSLRTRYVLVIVVEAIVIAVLYWVGRHFA